MKTKEKKEKNQEATPKAYDFGALAKIPYWIRALIVKYWFYGAICFFIGFGLGLVNYWFAFIGGLAFGALYDLCIKNLFIAMDTDKHESIYHVMCAKKKYYSLPINLIYCVGVFYLATFLISLINQMDGGKVSFGNEPFSFALIALVCEEAFMGIKYIVLLIIRKINKKNA